MLLGLFGNLRASRPAIHKGKRSLGLTSTQALKLKGRSLHTCFSTKKESLIWDAQRTEGLRRQSNAIAGL